MRSNTLHNISSLVRLIIDRYHSFGKKIYTQYSERCNKDKLSLIFISWSFHCLLFYVLYPRTLSHSLAFLLSLALIHSSVTFLLLTSFLCLSSINDCDIDWIALYTTEQNLPKGLLKMLKMLVINIGMPSSVHNMPCKHPHARAIFFLFFLLLSFTLFLSFSKVSSEVDLSRRAKTWNLAWRILLSAS